ncbi:MAG: hypothetical protein MMC23_010035 [Stictis urceolatum]|nr:hypothetical protein [Stictis urceolata]
MSEIITLLDLQASHGSDSVICNTQQVSIIDPPPYETLSYTWGDHQLTRSIIRNGSPEVVTESFYVILLRLRFEDQVRILWIDQLCIDQLNTEEKSHQVSLMRQIYQRSLQGLIWPGELLTGDEAPFDQKHVQDVFKLLEAFDINKDFDKDLSNSYCPERTNAYAEAIVALMGSRHAAWQKVK